MSSKKILVVFGSTGNQGGSVLETILGDPVASAEFQIHAVTRDPTKPAGVALAEKGVVVIKGDLNDKESLRNAIKGAYAVFAVTNFMEHFSKDHEAQQGKNIADVAKELNVQHLIWSSLPNVSKLTNNTLTNVLHFDGKAIVEEYIRSLEIPATFIHLGIFMDYPAFMLQPTSASTSPHSKSYKLAFPVPTSTKFPLISATKDTGTYVKAILGNRDSLLGKTISAAESFYSPDEIVAIMREEGGMKVVAEQCSEADYRAFLGSRGLPEFFQDDMYQNTRWIAEWGFFGEEKGLVERGHHILSEPLESFREWVQGGGLDAFK